MRGGICSSASSKYDRLISARKSGWTVGRCLLTHPPSVQCPLEVCRRSPGRPTGDAHIEGQALCLQPDVCLGRKASPGYFSGVPECGAGLCEVVASVCRFVGVRDAADKGEGFGVKRAQLSATFYNLVQSVVCPNDSPVFQFPVFEDTLNDVAWIFIQVNHRLINIPK